MGISKYILAILVGTMSALILYIIFRDAVVYHIYPLPTGIDEYDAASFSKAVATMPQKEFMLLLADSALTALLGGIVATLFVKRALRLPAMVTGIILTLAGLILALSLHYPSWVVIVGLFVYLPFTLLGYWLLRKR